MARSKPSRSYDASRRQQRALESQERMLEAARELFATRGYAETRLDDIARDADVSVASVYAAFGSKRGLLDMLMRRLVAGVQGGPPLVTTEGPRAIQAEPDARRALAMFVEHLSGVQERVIPMYEVMKHAARVEPELAELAATLQHYRYTNLRTLAARFAELGALRSQLSVEDASRTLWAITSPEVRQLLLGGAGWTTDKYRAWLESTLAAALLAENPQRKVRR